MYLDCALAPPLAAICSAHERGVCAWCHTALDTFMDDMACPHWFLLPGARAYQVATVAQVFQSFDLHSVITYLRVIAESDRGPRSRGAPYCERSANGERVIAINWRDRGWLFEFAAGQAAETTSFRLTTVHRAKLYEQAVIELPGPGRELAFSMVGPSRRKAHR